MTCGVRKRSPPTDRKTCHLFNSRSGVAQKKVKFSYVICPSVRFGHDAAHMTCNQKMPETCVLIMKLFPLGSSTGYMSSGLTVADHLR